MLLSVKAFKLLSQGKFEWSNGRTNPALEALIDILSLNVFSALLSLFIIVQKHLNGAA